ncbi:hypothetical protein Tco_1507172 [Tanacetum coccineum]
MASSSISVGNLDDDLSISSSLHNLTEDDSNELSAGTSLPKGEPTFALGHWFRVFKSDAFCPEDTRPEETFSTDISFRCVRRSELL